DRGPLGRRRPARCCATTDLEHSAARDSCAPVVVEQAALVPDRRYHSRAGEESIEVVAMRCANAIAHRGERFCAGGAVMRATGEYGPEGLDEHERDLHPHWLGHVARG